jgi:hypothetical protein
VFPVCAVGQKEGGRRGERNLGGRGRERKRCDFVLADVRIPFDLIKSGGPPTG